MQYSIELLIIIRQLKYNRYAFNAINLSGLSIGDEGVIALADALIHGQCAHIDMLQLQNNKIGPKGAQAIANALLKANCPKLEFIDLSNNQIGPEGAQALANAITLRPYHAPISFQLSNNKIGDEGFKSLITAYCSVMCSDKREAFEKDTKNHDSQYRHLDVEEIIRFSFDDVISAIGAKFIIETIFHSLSHDTAMSFLAKLILYGGTQFIVPFLSAGVCPEGLDIIIGYDDGFYTRRYAFSKRVLEDLNQRNNESIKALFLALMSDNCPKKLNIDIHEMRRICVTAAQVIVTALTSGKCPEGLSLMFSYCQQLPEGIVIELANALVVGKCPRNFKLYFKCADITNEMMALVEALKSGNCPEGFELYIDGDNASLTAMASALISGKCPQRLSLILPTDDECSEGFKSVTQALASGNCPSNLKITLYEDTRVDGDTIPVINKIENVVVLEQALLSGKCPENLNLCFTMIKDIDIAFYQAIANVLTSENCPNGLTLECIYYHGPYDAEGVYPHIESFLEHMRSNTKTVIKISDYSETKFYFSNELEKINKRNELIRKYPEFENYIKSIFYKYGLYKPGLSRFKPRSLKEMAGRARFNLFNTFLPSNYPPDLIDYVNKFVEIDEDIQSIIPEYRPYKETKKIHLVQPEQIDPPTKKRALTSAHVCNEE